MDDSDERYRRTKIAQKQAERGGFVGTAAALKGMADLLAVNTDVDPVVIRQFAARVDA